MANGNGNGNSSFIIVIVLVVAVAYWYFYIRHKGTTVAAPPTPTPTPTPTPSPSPVAPTTSTSTTITQGTYTAQMTGAQQVPPESTAAAGTFTLRDLGNTLSYSITLNNVPNPNQAHIHQGAAGTRPGSGGNALVSIPLSGQTASGNITSQQLEGPVAGKPVSALVAIIKAGNAYVNIHTPQFPHGLIRGPLK